MPIFVWMHNRLKHELHDLISGKSQVRFGAIIQAIASYLSDGLETSSAVEGAKQIREQERKRLEVFISEYDLWLNSIDFSQYVSEGAEQRVFLQEYLTVFPDLHLNKDKYREYLEPMLMIDQNGRQLERRMAF